MDLKNQENQLLQTFWEISRMVLPQFIEQLLAAGNLFIVKYYIDLNIFHRIVDFERDPPPGVTNFGKIHLELWDVGGDFKYEKCWAPI